MSCEETYEEARLAASQKERGHLHPLDYDDPRHDEEEEYWDAVDEWEAEHGE